MAITAAPAKHGVPEVTFVLRSGSEAVYFAGDPLSKSSPECRSLPTSMQPGRGP